MAYEFNIRQLLLQSHGYVGLDFPDLIHAGPKSNSKIGQAAFAKDALGRPLFMDVKIGGVQMPNEPLITFNTRKKIEETVLVGSEHRGTVKEFISAEDFQLKIEGICINFQNKSYPEAQVKKVIDLCEKNEALEFENDLGDMLKIHRIVVKEYGFGNMKGQPYSQSYYINAVSDFDFYAKVKDDRKYDGL